MNLHEYQAKQILQKYGIRVQEGYVAETPEQAVEGARRLQKEKGTSLWVLKAQIHAGGRGKAGGIQVARSLQEVESLAQELIGKVLVTPQTGPQGKKVHMILVAEDVYYPGALPHKEFYLSLLIDRSRRKIAVIHSPEGGVDIEEVAGKSPERIFKLWIDPITGYQPYHGWMVARNLQLEGEERKQMVRLLQGLYQAFVENDALLLEINPLLRASDGTLIVVDTKMQIDDNALFRQPSLEQLRDIREEDPAEVEASQYHLSFVKMDGNIGCMVNGAGLAMATMDIIQYHGGRPANFLDVGGRATPETVAAGFRLILRDPNVRAILVNIFGGIVRCDRVARGILQALEQLGKDVQVPVVVRLQGTNAEEARELISASPLNVIYTTELDEAARKVVELARAS